MNEYIQNHLEGLKRTSPQGEENKSPSKQLHQIKKKKSKSKKDNKDFFEKYIFPIVGTAIQSALDETLKGLMP